MRTLIFDTETTGMVNFKSDDILDQPHPVQLACMIVDESDDRKIINTASIIVAPGPGVYISAEAEAVHKITGEVIKKYGLPLRAACGIFMNFVLKSDRICGHNIDFDIVVMETALQVCGLSLDTFRKIPRVCTMLSTIEVCRLPGKRGFKWPKLEEAYRMIVNSEGFEGAHDAMADVKACNELLGKLQQMEIKLIGGRR